ncbi:uncharacterized protein DSM5745_05625 [Aspergillus mulundensis]|uniref:DNA/RNA-binding domain-containing protein n=1 Tax=Aspergillus mulundensis TaxID=1810919 RepID=A0A3D8RXJ6_9EURO|nr:Uncharacterized protein DSM5745_05625 [Aspergillus mulundensis]RDW78773.1 Uncharacterized protein DSM5745_05625 [Aspergillus mulundensis]
MPSSWTLRPPAPSKLKVASGRRISRSTPASESCSPAKLEKHYLEFIKSSQRFYRGYIQQLASHFGGISELEKVARKFSFDNLSAEPPVYPSEILRNYILQSCHATLIRLGDLSRYRETELVTKERNWGPAIGYYDLATVIYPASGASHNQLAVIALADANHLKATYHLYRALSAQEPHPGARGNLEIEFRKVRGLWAKQQLIPRGDAGIPGKALAPLFVYLHAQCYKGIDFTEHDELESEVLNQLAVDLKERSLEGTLQKFCLINIAAEDASRNRSNENSGTNAHLFFQRINVKTYFTLLQILLAEVERFAVEDSGSNNKEKVGADKVTVVARRILPALRNYSAWLLTVSSHLVAYKEKDTPLAVQLAEFWKIYANTLTLLASTFDVVHLPEVEYLLEEDEETLCFVPLSEGVTRRYLDAQGQQKPSMNDPGVERNHPNIEMLYRIREFVIDGLDLVVGNKIPIALVDDEDKKTFIYKEDGLPSQFFASPSGHHHSLSTASIEREDIQQVRQEANFQTDTRSTFGGSQSASVSMSAAMNGIVEGVERLVESDTYENAPVVPNRSFDPVANATPINDNVPTRQTPLAPPGLGPPLASYSAALPRVSSSQSFTPQAAIPGLPTIWSTGAFSPEFRDVSPRTPPGLGIQNPQGSMVTRNTSSPGLGYARQDTVKGDSIPRQSLFAQGQPESNSLNGNVPISPFLAPSIYHQRFSSSSWDPYGIAAPASPFLQQAYPRSAGFGPANQPMSSGFDNTSWANNAFIDNTISSGYVSSPGLDGARRAPSAPFGAIGQSPRLGHGG